MTDHRNEYEKVIGRLKPIDLFLIISFSITGIFFIMNWMNNGNLFEQCVLSAHDEFSDYFMHVVASSDRENLYSLSTDSFCFPPLAYCMYFLLWKINPLSVDDLLEWREFKQSNNAMLVFLAYIVLSVILLIWCITLYYKSIQTKYILLLPIAIFFSYPVFCTSIQRGNSVALVSIMIAVTWLWMDSNNRVEQELAMILIAIAAGFKFYPAILGFMYILKKDWKKTIRLIIYGIVAIFVPFILFGGIEGAKNLINTLFGLGSTDVLYRYGTIRGMVETIVHLDFSFDIAVAYKVGEIVETIFLIVSLGCICICRKKWQKALFFSGILASYVSSSWMYTSVYYLPALLVFLQENQRNMIDSTKKENIWIGFNSLCFGLIFSIPFFFNYIFSGQIYEGVFVVSYILLVVNMINVLIGFIINQLNSRRIIYADKM